MSNTTEPSLNAFLLALCASTLLLGACTKPMAVPPPASTLATNVDTGAAPIGSNVTPVPAAASVMSPASDIQADPAAGGFNTSMTRTQESAATPLPAQASDHSTPLSAAKRANAP
jgi:hypothetical protein